MKKLIVSLLTVALMLNTLFIPLAAAGSQPVTGDGSSSDPYQIGTADEFVWFSEQVNGGNTGLCAVLTNDVDVTAYPDIMIGTAAHPYSGTFNGNYKTVTFQLAVSADDSGLFGKVIGGTVKDMTVNGQITVNGVYTHIGVIGSARGGALIDGITSNVIINGSGECKHVGGVVGSSQTSETGTLTVKQCAFYGLIYLPYALDCVGGVMGYANEDVTITYCGFGGVIKAGSDAYVGGVLGYVNNTAFLELTNCCSYGDVKGGNSLMPEIIGVVKMEIASEKITNNLCGSNNPYGGAKKDLYTAIAVTDWSTGYATYTLNGGDTNNSYIWRQTLGEDEYPVLDPTHKSVRYAQDCEFVYRYMNEFSPFSYAHFYTNGICKYCGRYQEPTAMFNDYDYENYGIPEDYYGYLRIENLGELLWYRDYINKVTDTTRHALLYNDICINDETFTFNEDTGLVKVTDGTHTAYLGTGIEGKTGGNEIFDITPSEKGVFYGSENSTDTCEYGGTLISWDPIGTSSNNLRSRFEGYNRTISGIYINDSDTSYKGLFGCASATAQIDNLSITNSYINGKEYVGGLCGNLLGSAANCYTACTVIGNTGTNYAGGLCGYAGDTVSNCYYQAESISNHNGWSLDNSDDAYGKTAEQFKKGEVTWLLNGGETQTTSFKWYQTVGAGYPAYSGETVYSYTLCNGERLFTNDETLNEVVGEHPSYTEYGFCSLCGAYEPPTLVTAENYAQMGLEEADVGFYAVSNIGQFYWAREQVNSGNRAINVLLTVDITVNDETFTFDEDTGLVTVTDGTNISYLGTGIKGKSGGNTVFDTIAGTAGAFYTSNTSTASGEYSGDLKIWTPFGNSSNPYDGEFNGKGHTVSGLYINNSDDSMAMFGSKGAKPITNLNVSNSYIKGGSRTGGLTGQSRNIINNCVVDAIVLGSGEKAGIITADNSGQITGCRTKGIVSGVNQVGAAFGYSIYNSDYIISGCINEADVYGSEYVGGIGGNSIANVSNCCNMGDINGTIKVGGICGVVSSCSNSYNTGNVTGTECVGGITGSLGGDVSNCYNTGIITEIGKDNSAGIVGSKGGGTITNCFFLQGSATCGINANGTGYWANITPDKETNIKTAEEFANGTVAYLLNGSYVDGIWEKGAEDGSQIWYQNIDNGVTPYDTTPKFSGGNVYSYSENTYTNIWKSPYFDLSTGNSTIDDTNKYIYTDVRGSSSISAIVASSAGYTFDCTGSFGSGDSTRLGTGSTVHVKKNGTEVDLYTLVVYGDVNGDSVCDASDCFMAQLAANNNKTLSAVNTQAADIDGDGAITQNDYKQMLAKTVGK